MQNIASLLLGPMNGVESSLAAKNIGFGRMDPLSAFEDLPEQEQGEINRNADVGRDKIVAEKGLEGEEAVEQDDDDEKGKGEVGRVRLPGRAEDQGVSVHSLRFQRLVELDVSNAHVGPGEEVGDGGQVLEPGEHLGGTGRAAHVGQQRDGRRG